MASIIRVIHVDWLHDLLPASTLFRTLQYTPHGERIMSA
jgi:hypothetical protein